MSIDVDRLITLESAISFSNVHSSLGSVDKETGLEWRGAAQAYVVDGTLTSPT